jgi:hypothetical protein
MEYRRSVRPWIPWLLIGLGWLAFALFFASQLDDY